MSFPKSSSGSEEVTLKGPKDSVAEVKQRLLEITKELDNQITMNCVIPQVRTLDTSYRFSVVIG